MKFAVLLNVLSRSNHVYSCEQYEPDNTTLLVLDSYDVCGNN